MKENPKKGTFVVHIEYAQNHSWQGSVTWTDRNETEPFRSALELLHLIDNALMGAGTQNAEIEGAVFSPSVQSNPT